MAETKYFERQRAMAEIEQLLVSARNLGLQAAAAKAAADAQSVTLAADLAGLIPQDDDGSVFAACEAVQRRRHQVEFEKQQSAAKLKIEGLTAKEPYARMLADIASEAIDKGTQLYTLQKERADVFASEITSLVAEIDALGGK